MQNITKPCVAVTPASMTAEAMEAVYDLRWMIVFIFILIITDFWFGVSESRKCHKPFRLSKAGRRTCNKFVDYVAYLLFGAMLGMAIFEPLGIASHTVTAAVGLSLACVWELDSIISHVLTLHGIKGRLSIRKLLVAFARKKDADLGEALDDCLGEENKKN